jgi:predicted RNA binding protein YcfA (HicA-like mRNA interferase family)
MSASSEMREVLRSLERQGFTATKTRRGHWRFEHPDLRGPVFGASTPSDHRSIKNLRALIKRQLVHHNDN